MGWSVFKTWVVPSGTEPSLYTKCAVGAVLEGINFQVKHSGV